MTLETDDEAFASARNKIQEAVEEFFRVCEQVHGVQYMLTHWVLMAEGLVIDEPNNFVVLREVPDPAPSISKQLGLLQYGVIRLQKDIQEDDE